MTPVSLKEVKEQVKELVAFVFGLLMMLVVLFALVADNLGFKKVEVDTRLLALIFVVGLGLAFWFRIAALLNTLKSANIKGPGGIEIDLDGSDRRVEVRRETDREEE